MDVDMCAGSYGAPKVVEPHKLGSMSLLNVNAKEFKPSSILGKRRGKPSPKNLFQIQFFPENKQETNVNCFDDLSSASTCYSFERSSSSNVTMACEPDAKKL